MKVNEKCDVYCMGVAMLEILVGRHPADLISRRSSPAAYEVAVVDMLDQRLSPPKHNWLRK